MYKFFYLILTAFFLSGCASVNGVSLEELRSSKYQNQPLEILEDAIAVRGLVETALTSCYTRKRQSIIMYGAIPIITNIGGFKILKEDKGDILSLYVFTSNLGFGYLFGVDVIRVETKKTLVKMYARNAAWASSMDYVKERALGHDAICTF